MDDRSASRSNLFKLSLLVVFVFGIVISKGYDDAAASVPNIGNADFPKKHEPRRHVREEFVPGMVINKRSSL
jgi:hypothetical protein